MRRSAKIVEIFEKRFVARNNPHREKCLPGEKIIRLNGENYFGRDGLFVAVLVAR